MGEGEGDEEDESVGEIFDEVEDSRDPLLPMFISLPTCEGASSSGRSPKLGETVRSGCEST